MMPRDPQSATALRRPRFKERLQRSMEFMYPRLYLNLDPHRYWITIAILLCASIYFAYKGTRFFHTISRKLQFCTMAYVSKTSTKAVILSELNSIMDFYVARGLNIPDVHADIKFACVTNDTLATRINNTAADDHVGEMERSIYTTNNGVRSMTHVLPFKRIPKVNDD